MNNLIYALDIFGLICSSLILLAISIYVFAQNRTSIENRIFSYLSAALFFGHWVHFGDIFWLVIIGCCFRIMWLMHWERCLECMLHILC